MKTPKLNPTSKKKVKAFLELFCNGKNNAMTQNQIAKELKLDPRIIRMACSELDKEGMKIIGDNNGLYIPKSKEEQEHYAMRLFSQAELMLKRAKSHLRPNIYAGRMAKLYNELRGKKGSEKQLGIF